MSQVTVAAVARALNSLAEVVRQEQDHITVRALLRMSHDARPSSECECLDAINCSCVILSAHWGTSLGSVPVHGRQLCCPTQVDVNPSKDEAQSEGWSGERHQ